MQKQNFIQNIKHFVEKSFNFTRRPLSLSVFEFVYLESPSLHPILSLSPSLLVVRTRVKVSRWYIDEPYCLLSAKLFGWLAFFHCVGCYFKSQHTIWHWRCPRMEFFLFQREPLFGYDETVYKLSFILYNFFHHAALLLLLLFCGVVGNVGICHGFAMRHLNNTISKGTSFQKCQIKGLWEITCWQKSLAQY